MEISRRYNIVNNAIGWGVFVIALLTYWLTLEPTASYWDCGEFITQADKLEIGHPPGNPIFMLTARFFANFAFGDAASVALMVNAMSGLLSALTILLLFWTVTHLVRRLVLYNPRSNTSTDGEPSLAEYLVIMGSGVCGALAYAWSDTFWFSAVEAEVYAFSSFCTALVFWLILKWENRADEPRSDRYLILIAYVIGVSIAVHLLNLLCIPAIVLVYCYRRFPAMNVRKSLLALLVSFAIIVLVLYGLVPGFIQVAQWFELLCVNSLGMPFNSGTGVYTLLTVVIFVLALVAINKGTNLPLIRWTFLLAVLMSGMLFIGSSIVIGVLLAIALVVFLFFVWKKKLPLRWLTVALWSICVIFVGYSSYALILIRSSAQTPMNQNRPDNVFDLSTYLNREQYGQTPLLYGYTFESSPMQEHTNVIDPRENPTPEEKENGHFRTRVMKGNPQYAKGVKNAVPENEHDFLTDEQVEAVASKGKIAADFYAMYGYTSDYEMNPELNVLLPRIHSSAPGHDQAYELWVPSLRDADRVELSAYDPLTQSTIPLPSQQPELNEAGEYYYPTETARKPSFGQNLEFFFNYQLNHMYWRYFLWNFAGRQNDVNNQYGEKDAGNWLSGIPAIDNARLGDQSLLPAELGKDNKGHNIYFMLPLLLGLLGLLWQALRGRRGIEQFWVVFFLFFMTGIAIVLYLNQPPLQPRERDYAFAGSFYAFAIWIGMGVAAIRYGLLALAERRRAAKTTSSAPAAQAPGAPAADDARIGGAVWAALVVGLLVPLQMVSQTWDDHDRSGRYAARDYAINYLESLEPNAIIFCNGDNDTFPLWYAQEVEGVRPDVKIVNLSYLGSSWYANQQRLQTYTAAPIDFTATPADYAYGRRDVTYVTRITDQTTPTPLLTALKEIYSPEAMDLSYNLPAALHSNTYIPVDSAAVVKAGVVPPSQASIIEKQIPVRLSAMSLGKLLMLDIIATNAQNGWKRPIYWAMTVGSDQYSMFAPYLRSTGMALQLVPYQANQATDTRLGYPIVMKKYRWGGAENGKAYFDETAGRMLAGVRLTVLDLANALAQQKQYKKALQVLRKYEAKLGDGVRPAGFQDIYTLGTVYCVIGDETGDKVLVKHGLDILAAGLKRYASNVNYMFALAQKYGTSEVPASDGTSTIQVNAMTTPENQAILYTYYILVAAYDTYAGPGAAEKLLKSAGLGPKKLAKLKEYYEKSVDPTAAGGGGDQLNEYITELAKWTEVVVVMQQKSPEEYAKSDPMELEIDSAYSLALAQFLQMGGTEEMLAPITEQINKVDFDRSVRLSQEYQQNHPELAQ